MDEPTECVNKCQVFLIKRRWQKYSN